MSPFVGGKCRRHKGMIGKGTKAVYNSVPEQRSVSHPPDQMLDAFDLAPFKGGLILCLNKTEFINRNYTHVRRP